MGFMIFDPINKKFLLIQRRILILTAILFV